MLSMLAAISRTISKTFGRKSAGTSTSAAK